MQGCIEKAVTTFNSGLLLFNCIISCNIYLYFIKKIYTTTQLTHIDSGRLTEIML